MSGTSNNPASQEALVTAYINHQRQNLLWFSSISFTTFFEGRIQNTHTKEHNSNTTQYNRPRRLKVEQRDLTQRFKVEILARFNKEVIVASTWVWNGELVNVWLTIVIGYECGRQ